MKIRYRKDPADPRIKNQSHSGGSFLRLARGLDGDEVAVRVVAHGLRDLARQAEVVKIGNVAVLFKGADHADGLHGLRRLLRHDGAGGKLPAPHVRVEGRVMILRRAVGESSACVAYRKIAKLAENSPLADTIVLRDIRDLFL